MAGEGAIRLYPVYGNDEPHPIYVDAEELHPQSRLKQVIVSSTDMIMWGCSRATLISLIASQRHNRVIARGQVTHEEVMLELERDCVDIVAHIPPCDSQLARICRQLVDSILEWPSLQYGMDNLRRGDPNQLTCGYSFFYLAFPPKQYIDENAITGITGHGILQRATSEMIEYLTCEILSWEEHDPSWQRDVDSVNEFLMRMDTEKVAEDLRETPFWFMKHYFAFTCVQNRLRAALWRKVVTECSFQTLLRTLNNNVPDLEMLFHRTPMQSLEQCVLESTFLNRGYDIKWYSPADAPPTPYERPFLVPPMWRVRGWGVRSSIALMYVQKTFQ